MPITRRSFLRQVLVGGVTAVMIPWAVPASVLGAIHQKELSGRLSVCNMHTGESLCLRYLGLDGRWAPNALSRLNRLFRCHYDDAVREVDPAIFVLLDKIHTRLAACKRPINLISGYRSPEYNQLLLSMGRGVAKQSYHLKGMAADIQIEGISIKRLWEEAKRLKEGGVGQYSQFVHVDVGPVRCW